MHRYYDPVTGRYVTPDPIGLAGGINPFLYAEANPINYIDPFGLIGGPKFYWDKVQENPTVKDRHYDRNQYNQNVNYEEAKKSWTLLPPGQSIFHRMGPGNENNQKFVSSDGHSEAVFYPNGSVVNDPANMATYNFSPPSNWVGHFGYDVLPYWIWGNSLDDPTTWWERLTASYEGETPCE
ncbi:MAG: RHS repeat-associated core domain-containing protein [Desulfobacter sp.]|nr:MAG: RHS repeat-associated core domain-containing protein [Desulfobacter sp.]